MSDGLHRHYRALSRAGRSADRVGRIEYLNLLSYDEDDLLGALAARLMTGRRPMHSSPRYAKSDWCRREFEEFCKNAEAGSGLRLGDKSRVFKVVKTPVNPVELPPGMKALYETILGFEFYDLDPETGAVQEYDDAGDRAGDKVQLWDLETNALRAEHPAGAGALAWSPGGRAAGSGRATGRTDRP